MEKEEFKKIQAEIGWSNAETARQMGVCLKAVEHWRSGRRHIGGSVATLIRLLHSKEIRRQRAQAAQG